MILFRYVGTRQFNHQKLLSDFITNSEENKLSGSSNKNIFKSLKSKFFAHFMSNQKIYDIFGSLEDSLINNDEGELLLDDKGVISDLISEYLAKVINFHFDLDNP